MAVSRIPYIDRPSVAEFQDAFLKRQRPCVIRGGMKEWAAVERWSDDAYLREKVGNHVVSVTKTVGKDRLFVDEESSVVEMTVAEFLDIRHDDDADTKYFLMQRSLKENLAPLVDDMRTPEYVDESRLLLVNFWYCPGTNKTPLHCDWAANIVCQVTGSKRFVLFPPGAEVYPHPHKANFSQVDLEAPDLERFPRFDPSLRLEVDLQPGEMLHVPGLWYHQVYSQANIAVNWWWWPRGAALARTFLTKQFLTYAARHGRDKLTQRVFGKKEHAGVGGA